MAGFSIAFCTRELWPFVIGGGIGRTLHGTVSLLAAQPDVEVTVITRATFREEYERMHGEGDKRLPTAHFEFVADPEGFELGPFSSYQHCWSARVYERLCELYPDGGPDLVEFTDYLGEGFVTAQARRAGVPALRRTKVLVRLQTSLEVVDALNGHESPDEERRTIYTLERGALAMADHVLSPGGDVLGTYDRFYGRDAVRSGRVVPHVIVGAPDEATRRPPCGERTRLLFVGRLERRKGVEELVRAAARLDRDDWELTLLGGDTDTAPDGGSMLAHLRELSCGSERIVFHDRVPYERVLELMDEHHAVVIPSIWECWSAVAREALLRDRPVLASPTGALIDAVAPGASGWLTRGTSTEDIESGLVQVLDSRAEIEEMIREARPQARLDELLDPEATLRAYREFAAKEQDPVPVDADDESVTAVVVSSIGDGSIERTLDSLRGLRRPVDEVVLVCDGLERLPSGFRSGRVDSLEVLDVGAGRAACANAGCERARGSHILLLDAGMALDPLLLERLLAALRLNSGAAYATSWAHGLDPSAVPLGNYANFAPEHDNAAVAPLVRREVFDRGHRFDVSREACAGREFWAGLAADGLFGCVLPERLVSWAPFSAPCGDPSLVERGNRLRTERAEPMSWLAPVGG